MEFRGKKRYNHRRKKIRKNIGGKLMEQLREYLRNPAKATTAWLKTQFHSFLKAIFIEALFGVAAKSPAAAFAATAASPSNRKATAAPMASTVEPNPGSNERKIVFDGELTAEELKTIRAREATWPPQRPGITYDDEPGDPLAASFKPTGEITYDDEHAPTRPRASMVNARGRDI